MTVTSAMQPEAMHRLGRHHQAKAHWDSPVTCCAARLLSPRLLDCLGKTLCRPNSPRSCGTFKTVSKTPRLPDFITGLIPAVVLGLVLRKQVFPDDTPMFSDTSISPESSQDLPAARLLVVSWGVLGVLSPQHPRDHSKHRGATGIAFFLSLGLMRSKPSAAWHEVPQERHNPPGLHTTPEAPQNQLEREAGRGHGHKQSCGKSAQPPVGATRMEC